MVTSRTDKTISHIKKTTQKNKKEIKKQGAKIGNKYIMKSNFFLQFLGNYKKK